MDGPNDKLGCIAALILLVVVFGISVAGEAIKAWIWFKVWGGG